MTRRRFVLSCIISLLLCLPALAQEAGGAAPAERRYEPNIANEDWSFLADPAKRVDFFDPIKYMALGRDGWFATIGGEVRMRPESLRLEGGEGIPDTVDRYLLQRYLFSGSIHMGSRLRFFAEVQAGIINGKLGAPRPSDQNVTDVHQGFVQLNSRRSSARSWIVRIGRQELSVGSSRLISASQGLNVKRSFDGLSGAYSAGRWAFDSGVARLVDALPGAFDDASDPDQQFWGVSAIRSQFPWSGGRVGVYYLGIDRARSVFVQGVSPEQRHTLGARVAGRWKRLEVNYDLVSQWGEFGTAPIRAWAVATENRLRFPETRFRPSAAVRVNAGSGDADPTDGRLESFNPLFPGNAYSGIVGLLGPTNLMDVTPTAQVALGTKVQLMFESPIYWRLSTRDALYGVDLRVLVVPRQSQERYVGTNPAIILFWTPTRHSTITATTTAFRAGAFLAPTFVGNGFLFTSLSYTYRF